MNYILKYVFDGIVTFDLENTPYLVMCTGTGVLKKNWIKPVCNKHAFIVPDVCTVNFKTNIREKTG
jgi:hypothetical protein